MGKNLKGRELGKGIVQRKDGKYSGRYTGADGKRHERVCEKLRDAREYVKNGNLEKRGFRFWTVQEQLAFIEEIKGKAYENQFQIMLQTGEMMGLY